MRLGLQCWQQANNPPSVRMYTHIEILSDSERRGITFFLTEPWPPHTSEISAKIQDITELSCVKYTKLLEEHLRVHPE